MFRWHAGNHKFLKASIRTCMIGIGEPSPQRKILIRWCIFLPKSLYFVQMKLLLSSLIDSNKSLSCNYHHKMKLIRVYLNMSSKVWLQNLWSQGPWIFGTLWTRSCEFGNDVLTLLLPHLFIYLFFEKCNGWFHLW